MSESAEETWRGEALGRGKVPAVWALRRLVDWLSTAALWTAGAGLAVMTVMVAWQVFGRYVLNDSPAWTEPSSLLLMAWFILLGAAVGVREGNHLGFELGLHMAPPPLRRALEAVTHLLVAAFGGAMIWYGVALAIRTWAATLPVLDIPGGIEYLPIAVGGLLIALFSLERLVTSLAGAEP